MEQGGSFKEVAKRNQPSGISYSWGRILDTKDLEREVAPALGTTTLGLNDAVTQKAHGKLFYFHEIAVLPEARTGGLNSPRFLSLPGIELAHSQGIRQNLFWSTPESPIVHITKRFGYETIFSCEAHNHKIIFLLQKDHTALLNAMKNSNQKKLTAFNPKGEVSYS